MRRLPFLFLLLLPGAAIARPAADLPSGPAPEPVLEWSVDLPQPLLEPVRSLPGIGILLHTATSLDVRGWKSGAPIWGRADLGGGYLQHTAIRTADGRLVVGWAGPGTSAAGRLVALDGATGETLLEAALPARPTAPPLPQALPRGMPRWSVPLEGGRIAALGSEGRVLTVTPAGDSTEGDLLLVAGRVTAIGAETGRLLLPFRTPGRPRVSGLAAGTVRVDGEQLFGAGEGWFARWNCRETRRGRLRCSRRWRQVLGGGVTAPPLLTDSRALVGSWDTFLYAFERKNGHLAWRRQVGRRLKRELRRLGSMVLVPAGDEEIRAYRIRDGAPAGRLRAGTDERFPFGIAVGEGLLLVPTQRVPGEQMKLRAHRWPEPEPTS